MSRNGMLPATASRRVRVMENLDQSRWDAVQRREKNLEEDFVYAVASTGVACRPVCAAGTPRRDNVEFFSPLRAAGVAGYRACRRCRPSEQRLHDTSLWAVIP